ncbi:MAG: hypothetical protein DRO73_05120 [Candidatus Thorarchaeota archaeon]|nr:MAG: hypothetical protein DRO73_05120 [Candidatus Thorarchaeota archaeon]RLI60070.1 MAG: hypothetical protein DRO93_07590 [Candidatus Thorarchaeota archaeon]
MTPNVHGGLAASPRPPSILGRPEGRKPVKHRTVEGMNLILGFIMIIGLSLLFAGVLLLLGRSVAPPARQTGAAVESYACGEPGFPGGKVQFHLQLFNYALYFMLFDIIGFMLFLSWSNPGIVVIAYLLVALVAAAYVSISPQND